MAAPKPFTPAQERFGSVAIRWMSRANVWLFRLSGGRRGARVPGGAPILLLTVKGRKSGAPRTVPLLYLADGDRLVLVASKGGMSHHPTWYLNLEANPDVEVEIGNERRPMVARTASAEEKRALWPRLTQMYRDYDTYQARTTRDIPVVILSPSLHRP
jgi:deazaflavin-dependent oxidoreductase (nitroreductase family)